MYAIVLAGGVGTRLWPRSRQSRPKQFSDITGCGRTMLQSTVDRLQGLASDHQIYVITGRDHVGLVREQAGQIPFDNIIVEPCGRNTAPAIGLALIHLRHQGINDVVAVLPADHSIENVERLQMALRRAEKAANEGYIVTLGIEAHVPHTGYGYIKRGGETLFQEESRQNGEIQPGTIQVGTIQDGTVQDGTVHDGGALPIYEVEHFLEKPDLTTAQQFLDEGGYYWNGGIFVSRVDRMLAEFATQMPELYVRLVEIEESLGDPIAAEKTLAEIWPQLADISIDYGIIEGAKEVAVVPLQAGWNDAGSWDALDQLLTSDESANVQVRGDMLLLESKGNIIDGGSRFMALIGVSDLVVVDTGDALLIGHKSQIQRVKHVVEHLRQRNRAELL